MDLAQHYTIMVVVQLTSINDIVKYTKEKISPHRHTSLRLLYAPVRVDGLIDWTIPFLPRDMT